MTDFEHDGLRCLWVHPESGATVACEDMPAELLPTAPQPGVVLAGHP